MQEYPCRMSKWNIIEAAQRHRDLKKMLKKYPRETRQMLVNLVRYREALEGCDNPLLLVQFPFVHRETSGCHALTQHPLSSAAQTRLYLYCHIDEHNLHLLLRQLKNIALTKRQIGIWRLFASVSERKISPGRGVRTLAGGKSASALAAPGKLKKISEPRRGDRKHSISVLHRFLSPLRGSILFCRIPGAAPG